MLRGLLKRLFVGPVQSTYLVESSTGAPLVSPHGALRQTPVYRAVTLIAGDVARIESRFPASPVADALWRNPTRLMPAYEFRRSLTMQACLWGNAFALINRTRGGELLELIPLDADSVSLDTTGPVPFYRSSQYGDRIPMESMLHLRAPGTTGLWGESPVRLCQVALTTSAAQNQMTLSAYLNGGNPKIAIVTPGPLSLEARQRIMADYEQRHAGTANTGRPLVLAEGARIERISSSMDDTGLDAARQYSLEDVSRIYGVPSHMLMSTANTQYGSLEWSGRAYVDSCLSHWMNAWQAELLMKLATPFDSMTWDVDALVRPGIAEQMAALRTGVEAGFLTRNEARARLDLEPLPGLDEPTLALNVGTGGGQTNAGSDTSAEAGTPNDF